MKIVDFIEIYNFVKPFSFEIILRLNIPYNFKFEF
jgi:hypothetical protein